MDAYKISNDSNQNGNVNVNGTVNEGQEKDGDEGIYVVPDIVEIDESDENDENNECVLIENREGFENTVSEDVTKNFEKELQCSICMELFVKAQTLNCSHTFCKVCIDEWKKKHKICPICRVKIKSVIPSTVLDNLVNTIISLSSEEVKESRKILLEERELLSDKPPRQYVRFKRDNRLVRNAVLGTISRRTSSSILTTENNFPRPCAYLRAVSTPIHSSDEDYDDYSINNSFLIVVDSDVDMDSDAMEL